MWKFNFSHHILIFTYESKNRLYSKKKKIFHLSTLIASSFEYDNESVIFFTTFFTSKNRKIGCIWRKRKYSIRYLSTLTSSIEFRMRKSNFSHHIFYVVEESKNRLYPKKKKIFHSDRISSCESLIFFSPRFNFYLRIEESVVSEEKENIPF